MNEKENKNVRIIDIAKAAKVSPGTVDRVLHNRGRVSEEKKKRIEKVLKKFDYKPNIIAQSLAKKKTYTFISLTPSFEKGEYWETVNNGILLAEKELRTFNVSIKQLYFDQYDKKSFSKCLKQLKKETFDGLLVATLFGESVIELSEMMDKQKIPYIYIDADIPEQNNLAYFGANSYDSGSIAAKLLLREIDNESDIFIAHYKGKTNKPSTQTLNREKGFREWLQKVKFSGNIHVLEYTKNTICNKEILDQLTLQKSVCGCVVFNSRIYELVKLLKETGINKQQMKLIGYDPVKKNITALEKEEIIFLISQRSEMQGYNGIKALSNHLIFHEKIKKTNFMPIDILIKENISYYTNYK